EISSYLEKSKSSSSKNCPTVTAVEWYSSVSPSIVNKTLFAFSKRISIPSTIASFSPCDNSSYWLTSTPKSSSNSPTVALSVLIVCTSPSSAKTTSDFVASRNTHVENIITNIPATTV